MPIRWDLKHFYQTPEYRSARALVEKRSRNCCEQCSKPNQALVWVVRTLVPLNQYWTLLGGPMPRQWHSCDPSSASSPPRAVDPWLEARVIRVVLTMAHLDHDPANNQDSNVKFLCQWCHLHHDAPHHKETRSRRKDAARPLLNA